jgi:hypothetical protein
MILLNSISCYRLVVTFARAGDPRQMDMTIGPSAVSPETSAAARSKNPSHAHPAAGECRQIDHWIKQRAAASVEAMRNQQNFCYRFYSWHPQVPGIPVSSCSFPEARGAGAASASLPCFSAAADSRFRRRWERIVIPATANSASLGRRLARPPISFLWRDAPIRLAFLSLREHITATDDTIRGGESRSATRIAAPSACKRNSNMTLLTHAPGPSFRGAGSKARQDTGAVAAPAEGSSAKTMARICAFVFTVTLMTAALAAVIALKASIYLARLNY